MREKMMSNNLCNKRVNTLLRPSISAVFLILLFLQSIIGCGSFTTLTNSTKKMVIDIGSSDKDLKKKVGIALFGHKTFPSDNDLEAILQKALIEKINAECSNVILVNPGDSGYPDFLAVLPRYASGKINNFALTQKSRQFGFNAIVTGESIDISEEVKERGLLWFKSIHNYARIRVTVNAYDTSTGAKFFEEVLNRQIEVDVTTLEAIKAKKFNSIAGMNNTLVDAANEVGEKICEMINIEKWKGYVIAANENRITISSGRNSGLKPGDILEVYDSSTIKGVDGQQYYLPGPKIGDIKISAITADQAKAIPVSGEKIIVGSLVLRKD